LPLKEGIVVGVTGALMARGSNSTLPYTALFAETQSNLPDSKSSAAIIRALDKYLNLDVDPGPLLKQAQQFEGKLKGLLVQAKKTEELQNDKADYFG
jgi:predicted ATP-grasp superfamily ATP-dependent carboligase